ncbi:DUF3558 domain-containing protein [Rhodococcus sp. BP-252]|nr:DUF3558 domain-containing protein [Rhodococcus sp. BP-320]MBY6419072.1 DUF3558 domain-containing protein [Rhodococcus sp. BP-321]MBY6423742.1 DUF3558 domain-containing protein [Rhodococcus sp. BP-324]MBY6429106.1 DUF3558 domain-containing protein [Rhodococcus sp. BP-323]MBY6434112.1 DUF3558 domain-containing protein [Rhodococcus sp. BP-322]MBY6443045.1 DUF3558 domain-containing protein [Rhodococcus sp. BP-319]MBY6447816.1 DUF3558 domain-containing protein [Rhodococcus sp. BP-318]MBY645271
MSAAALLVVACGRDVQPEAAAEPTRWDPCSITPEQIAATGLDPAYRDEGWEDGIVVEDWSLCSFKPVGVNVDYFLSVKSSSTHTFADVRQDSLEFELLDMEVADRDAFQYRREMGRSAVACSVGMDVPPGIAVFTVNYLDYFEGEPDPCAIVRQHTFDLKTALPPVAK